jgi:hypothetical protein
MDLEETEARNNYAGLRQQQFNRPSEDKKPLNMKAEESPLLGNRYQATTSENLGDYACAVVRSREHELMKALFSKSISNPISVS